MISVPDASLSAAATIVSLGLADRVARQWRARRRPYQLAWAIALGLFAIGAACQLVGATVGWSGPVYRVWYASGALLAAAWLGQGTVLLLAGRRLGLILTGLLVAGSLAGTVVVAAVPIDLIRGTTGGAASGAGFPDTTRLLTPVFNVYGTAALVVGAALSTWRWVWGGGNGRRAAGTALIGLGAIIVASGGTLTRLGAPGVLYASELLGVVTIFVGFTLTDSARGVVPTPSAEWLDRRRGRVQAFGIAFGVLGIFGALAVLPVLPWTMGIVTDVKYSYTDTVPADNEGTYLVTDKGAMELYAWAVEPEDFPPDAPSMPLGSVHEIVVVQKVFDDVSKYQLYNLDTETLIPWGGSSADGTELTLHPRELPAGQYVLVVPSSGMFGGESMDYFRVL